MKRRRLCISDSVVKKMGNFKRRELFKKKFEKAKGMDIVYTKLLYIRRDYVTFKMG